MDTAVAESVTDHAGVFIIPDPNLGHAEVHWKKSDKKDTDIARETFIKYKAQGYAIYRVDPKTGDKGELLKEFDPNAEKLIAVAPMAGG